MSSLKFLSRQKFKDYLSATALDESYDYFQDGTLKLHWSNFKALSSFFRERAKENQALIHSCEKQLEEIKREIVWLRNRRGIVKMTLFDLYHAYSDPLLNGSVFKQEGDDQFCYSMGTEAGPFHSVANLSWMNPEIYRYFIYHKILKGVLRQRDFRLSLNLPIQFSRANSPLDFHQGRLVQVTSRGLLFEHGPSFRPLSERGVVHDRINIHLPKSFVFEGLANPCFKNLALCLKQHSKAQMRMDYDFQCELHYKMSENKRKNFIYMDFEAIVGERSAPLREFFLKLLQTGEEETLQLFDKTA